MKAMIWEDYNKLVWSDVPDPICDSNGVVIKVLSAGVCATDLHIITGSFAHAQPPHILGHEICGEVVEIGELVKTVAVGERVVVETGVGCMACEHCRSGNKHLCDKGGEIGYNPNLGGYAQLVKVPEGCIRKIPKAISHDAGGILEAVVCPVGALYNVDFEPGCTVLIQGAGVAGLSFAQGARIFGAAKIIVTVRNETRFDFAKKFGADVVIDTSKEDLEARVMEETGGSGADLSIDAAGVVETIESAVRLCKKNGTVLLYGIPDDSKKINFPVKEIVLKQITVKGLTNNELAWDPIIKMAAKGMLNLDEFVTHRFKLSELDKAIDLLKSHPDHLIKAVVHPWED